MGKNIGYYLLEDSQIEVLSSSVSNFDDILNNDILLFHEFNDIPFWKSNIEFGQGVKAWNAMFELLFRIDESKNKSLKKHLSKILKSEESFIVLNESIIADVWIGLKAISIKTIELALKDNLLTRSIKLSKGYRMQSIENVDVIIIEFMELFNAFYKAQQLNKKILIKLD